ncbi:MAG TPA: cyclopropane-fatty-acyl-phospholipid synthase family protein [Burkholderiales bacterium]|nr:cyclopropane-fatty-acyl-phospholipid synthase family protein [Burkholderiales bacterium]
MSDEHLEAVRAAAGDAATQAREHPPASPDGRLLRRLLDALGNPPLRVTLWNGDSIATREPVAATIRISSRAALFKLLINPELHFGDAYADGTLEVEGDLVQLLEDVYRALPHARSSGLRHRISDWLHSGRRNTLAGSRRNIHRHYDLGNDFYRLWLDRDMLYTCAYFATPQATLEQAQTAKLEHVCRKIRLRAGDTLYEAGCGWGAFAMYAATHYGAKVTAFNISREQIAFARERTRALGLQDRVEFVEEDYRNISGHCDAFVSIGMLEHVGREHYRELGAVIDRCLDGAGRGLIHSIGRDRPEPLNAWIVKRIFPGAYPPTLREMMDIFEPLGFSVLDVENLRLHYALTLRHWLERYEEARERVLAMYDEPFVRAWRLYLAGSIAAFNAGALQLFQVVFNRSGYNDVPWTREHLYRSAAR